MNNKLSKIIEQLIPFIILGVAIALVIGLFIMLSYALIWGLCLGAFIWGVVMIKNYFFPTPSLKKEGRVIEHDDLK